MTEKPIHYAEFSNQRSPMFEFLHNELKQADVCFMKLLAEDYKKKSFNLNSNHTVHIFFKKLVMNHD